MRGKRTFDHLDVVGNEIDIVLYFEARMTSFLEQYATGAHLEHNRFHVSNGRRHRHLRKATNCQSSSCGSETREAIPEDDVQRCNDVIQAQ